MVSIKMIFRLFYLLFISIGVLGETLVNVLLINVKNQGGEVVQETIFSNISDDTITLEFLRTDGTLVTQLIDFRNDVQILKVLVLGEEERGQSQYQVMCFVSHFNKDDFITPEAMAKLRQKNPGTVRSPEEDRGRENFTMDAFINVGKSGVLSHHIATMCSEAEEATYTRESDIKKWAARPGASLSSLLSMLTDYSQKNNVDTNHKGLSRCFETLSTRSPCTCHIEICIGWYPCDLKYCKGKGDGKSGSNSNSGTYRCGIKTCRKCSSFSYYVKQKQLCLWDE